MTLRETEPVLVTAGGHSLPDDHCSSAAETSGQPIADATPEGPLAGPGIAHTTSAAHRTRGDPTPFEPAEHVVATKLPMRAHGVGRSSNDTHSGAADANHFDQADVVASAMDLLPGRGVGPSGTGFHPSPADANLSDPAYAPLGTDPGPQGRGGSRTIREDHPSHAPADQSPQEGGGGLTGLVDQRELAPAEDTHPADLATPPKAALPDGGAGHTPTGTRSSDARATKTRRPKAGLNPDRITAGGGDGQEISASLPDAAVARKSRRAKNDMQPEKASLGEGDGHCSAENQSSYVVATIVDLWRQRVDLKRAAQRLNLQALAVCRRANDGDKEAGQKAWGLIQKGKGDDTLAMVIEPYRLAMAGLEVSASALEKQLAKLVRQQPIWAWAVDIRGLGELSIAGLIGESSGNPGDYKSVSALWKRFGLAVIEGERQRRVAGAEQALIHGYAPQRRAFAYVISCNLMKSQKAEDPYRALYDRRKAYELAREIPKAHAHNRALRVMVKDLLKDLWAADRRARAA